MAVAASVLTATIVGDTLTLVLYDASSDADTTVFIYRCSTTFAAKFDAVSTDAIYVELRDIMVNIKSGVTRLSVAEGNVRIMDKTFDFDAHVKAVAAAAAAST